MKKLLNGNILNKPNSKIQAFFVLDAVLINAAYVLTTGMVLSGFAIFMGAGDFLVALLNNSMNFSTILSLFSFVIFERLSKRKKVLLTLNTVSRLLICLIIVLPLIPVETNLKLVLLTIMVIVSDVVWSIYRVGWLVWMMDNVPRESKSQFVYLRMMLVRIGMSLVTLLSGFILDYFDKGYTGFLIIFLISFALSLSDVLLLKNIEDIEFKTSDRSRRAKLFTEPVKMVEYRRFLLFIAFFYLFQTMATTFTTIYQIKYLELDYKFISFINVLSLTIMILSNRFWEKFERNRGFRLTLCLTSLFLASELLVLSFVNISTYYLLFLSTLVSGIGMGGFGVSIMTYRYDISAEEGRTMYEGWFYFASGLGMLIAPFLGEFLINIIPDFSFLYIKSNIQVLYFISFTLICILTLMSFESLTKLGKTEQ